MTANSPKSAVRGVVYGIVRSIDACTLAGVRAASIFMVLIVLMILVEIVARTFFHASTLVADEYSAYFFVAVVMLGLAYTLRERGHIRITLLFSRFGPGTERALDITATLMAMALCTFALYHAGMMVYDTYSLDMTADSISETPIWIPQIVIPLGLLLFDLQLLAKLLRRLFPEEPGVRKP